MRNKKKVENVRLLESLENGAKNFRKKTHKYVEIPKDIYVVLMTLNCIECCKQVYIHPNAR